MKLAFALLLTASLHAQIVVINPTDNGAVSLNKINANFAYLDLHGGGGTVTGSSAQVLVNGGSPGSCSTGTCTVSLAGPIYFNPVPGVYSGITIGPYVGSGAYAAGLTVGVPTGATTNLAAAFGGGVAIGAASGNANAVSNFAATGLTQTVVEPTYPATNPANIGGGNLQTALATTVSIGGLFNPAAYGNVAGQVFNTQILNGMNSNDNSNKDTSFGQEFNTTFNGSGQKYGIAAGATCYGAGDCFGTNFAAFYNNRSTAYGDEGTKVIDVYLQQNWNTTPQSSISVTTTTCAATSLNANVSGSSTPTDIKTVAVNGTLTNCHAGDWIDVDQGAFGQTGAGPTGNSYHEAVQLTAVGSGTISALFHLGHSSGAPLAPSPVIAVSPTSAPTWGQNSIVVDSAVTYSTGTAYVSAQSLTYPFATVTGIGTTWTSITHSGTNLQYCISFSGDNFTAGANPNQQAWYPVASIVGDTSLYIGYYPGGYTGSVLTSGGATSYSISQCGEILEMPVSYGSTANTIAGLAMNANPNGWTNGHNVYQIISPVAEPSAGIAAQYWHYGPSLTQPTFYQAEVLGGAPAYAVLVGLGGPLTSAQASYTWGIITPSTQNAALYLPELSMVGLAMELDTSATAIPGGSWQPAGTTGDPKAIFWKGDSVHDQLWIHPGTTGTGLVVHTGSGNTPALTFMEDTAVVGTIQAPGGSGYDWNLPPQSGAIGVFPASTVVNSAVCIKSASPLSLGYCSSVVGVGGTCTCN